MSEEEIKQILKEINWDTSATVEEIYSVFKGDVKKIGGIDKNWIYHKVLNGYSWYKVINVFPKEELPQILSEEIIQRLFPRPLRDKYRHVRNALYE